MGDAARVAAAASADMPEQLIGVWKLKSFAFEFQDTGENGPVLGHSPPGYLVLLPGRRMMALITAADRKTPRTDAEKAAAFQAMYAYSGSYRVEKDQWITAVDVAWNQAWVGTEQARSFTLEGDRLTVSTDWVRSVNFDGRIVRVIAIWQRDT